MHICALGRQQRRFNIHARFSARTLIFASLRPPYFHINVIRDKMTRRVSFHESTSPRRVRVSVRRVSREDISRLAPLIFIALLARSISPNLFFIRHESSLFYGSNTPPPRPRLHPRPADLREHVPASKRPARRCRGRYQACCILLNGNSDVNHSGELICITTRRNNARARARGAVYQIVIRRSRGGEAGARTAPGFEPLQLRLDL